MKRPRKRPNFHLSRARSFWRLARKAKIAGNDHHHDWYAYQAQRAYTEYTRSIK